MLGDSVERESFLLLLSLAKRHARDLGRGSHTDGNVFVQYVLCISLYRGDDMVTNNVFSFPEYFFVQCTSTGAATDTKAREQH